MNVGEMHDAQRRVFQHLVQTTVEVEPRIRDNCGAGVIFTKEGHIVTAHHNIVGERVVKVSTWRLVNQRGWKLLKQDVRICDVLFEDMEADIAILGMRKPPAYLVPAVLGTSFMVKAKDPVFRVGRSQHNQLSCGHIIDASARDKERNYPEFQISLPSAAGTSGAGIFDPYGRVLGISLRGNDEYYLPQIAYALPIDIIKSDILWRWMRGRNPPGFLPSTNPLMDAMLKR